MSARPLLVTGASGFVGRHLLEANAARPAPRPVLGLVRDPEAWRAEPWTADLDEVGLVAGSVTEPDAWRDALPPLGGIAHLAALVRHSRHAPEEMLRTNVEGALAMVRLAAEHGCRLVVVSTTGTVGSFHSPDEHADEKSPFCDTAVAGWPYYCSKIEMERKSRALAEALGVELVFVRPPILLGPGDHRFRSTSNVLKVLRGRLPFVVRGGMAFADVRDAAQALLVALERQDVQPVYHLPGHECSVVEFFEMLEEVSGAPQPRFVLPFAPAWALASLVEGLGARLQGEPPHLLPDPVVVEMASRYWGTRSLYARAELGFRSRDPRETLRDTADWLRAHHEALRVDA